MPRFDLLELNVAQGNHVLLEMGTSVNEYNWLSVILSNDFNIYVINARSNHALIDIKVFQ